MDRSLPVRIVASRAFAWYGGLAGLLALYYLAAVSVGVAPALGTSATSVLGVQIIPDLIVGYVVLRIAWISVWRARGFEQIRTEVQSDLVSRDTAERLLGIPLLVLSTVVAFDIFGAFKRAIPDLGAYRWDPLFASIDRFLHLGRDPWVWTHVVPPDSMAFRLVDQVYTSWYATLIVTILIFATWAPLRVRIRFFGSLFLSLMLLGSLAAIVFASGGPVYFGQFTGDTERFAPLVASLAGTAADVAQGNLWGAFANESEWLYGGISAMPSMHVALVVLMAAGTLSWNRIAGVVMSFYALLIMVGSVLLGWHYAIDGYVGAVAVAFIWVASGRLYGGWIPEGEGDPTPQATPAGQVERAS